LDGQRKTGWTSLDNTWRTQTLMLRSVVVVSTKYDLLSHQSCLVYFLLVFTTRKLVAFNSKTIILISRPWSLHWRLQLTNCSVWPLFRGKRWLKKFQKFV